MTLRFFVNDPLTHDRLGQVFPNAYSFGFPLTGVGEISMKVAMPKDTSSGSLVRRMVPNTCEVEVAYNDPKLGGKTLFTGWLNRRLPDPHNNLLTFSGTSWKGWLYKRKVPPNTFPDNLIEDDEHTIAYSLIDWACAPSAAPTFPHGNDIGGQNRQLTIRPWWTIGTALDTVGKRNNGYEWDIYGRYSPDLERIENVFYLFEPNAYRQNPAGIRIDNGYNSHWSIGLLDEDGTRQATRMYATSDGDQPTFASDSYESLGDGSLLLLEDSTSYQDNNNPALLFSYARAERLARDNPYTTIQASILLEDFDITNFRTGDFVRLIVKDKWNDINRDKVRVTDMSVVKQNQNSPTMVTLTLDLSLSGVSTEE